MNRLIKIKFFLTQVMYKVIKKNSDICSTYRKYFKGN